MLHSFQLYFQKDVLKWLIQHMISLDTKNYEKYIWTETLKKIQ